MSFLRSGSTPWFQSPKQVIIGARNICAAPAIAAIFIVAIDRILCELSGLLVRESGLACQVGRPFERRQQREAPDALQIGMPFYGVR